jgi:heterodisulfide reductase subunit A
MKEPEAATEKAKDLVKMGVAKAILLEEGEEIRLPVGTDCMIIGGGMAGMTAALNIAEQGFKAYIVEKQPQLGGILNRISNVSHNHINMPASEIVKAKMDLVEANPNITVYTSTDIESVDGYIGNYKIVLNAKEETVNLDISTVIVATGMREIEPEGMFQYGKDPRVITQLQLEGLIKVWNAECGLQPGGAYAPEGMRNGEGGITNIEIRNPKPARRTAGGSEIRIQDVVIINCVGSKNEERGCCTLGCPISVKNALAIKKISKDINVHILYRDLSMVKDEQIHLQAAKAAGIKFVRFPDDRYPEVTKEDGRLSVD